MESFYSYTYEWQRDHLLLKTSQLAAPITPMTTFSFVRAVFLLSRTSLRRRSTLTTSDLTWLFRRVSEPITQYAQYILTTWSNTAITSLSTRLSLPFSHTGMSSLVRSAGKWPLFTPLSLIKRSSNSWQTHGAAMTPSSTITSAKAQAGWTIESLRATCATKLNTKLQRNCLTTRLPSLTRLRFNLSPQNANGSQ